MVTKGSLFPPQMIVLSTYNSADNWKMAYIVGTSVIFIEIRN
jgi:leucyl aminopeptidase